MVPIQVLVGVPAWWSSETNRREAETGEAAARAGDHLFLVQRVATAGAIWRQTSRVARRRLVAVFVCCGSGIGSGGAPSQWSTHDHVVVVQMGKRRQRWRPVGHSRPPAIREASGSQRLGCLKGEFGVRR